MPVDLYAPDTTRVEPPAYRDAQVFREVEPFLDVGKLVLDALQQGDDAPTLRRLACSVTSSCTLDGVGLDAELTHERLAPLAVALSHLHREDVPCERVLVLDVLAREAEDELLLRGERRPLGLRLARTDAVEVACPLAHGGDRPGCEPGARLLVAEVACVHALVEQVIEASPAC